MSRNPYAPPEAPVAEIVPAALGQAPRVVIHAVRLLWVQFGIATFYLMFVRMVVQAPFGGIPVAAWIGASIGLLIGIGIAAWFYGKIARGRNWARILILVFALIGIVVIPFKWQQQLAVTHGAPLLIGIGLSATAIQFCAVVLLFTKDANPWFRRDHEGEPVR